MIKNFKFNLKDTFYELIENILNYIKSKTAKYIIVFDQHNKFSDPEQKVKNIIEKLLSDKNISKNFLFFSFMSLNNKDIKDFKAKNLFEIKKGENHPNFEIKDLICDKEFPNVKK